MTKHVVIQFDTMTQASFLNKWLHLDGTDDKSILQGKIKDITV